MSQIQLKSRRLPVHYAYISQPGPPWNRCRQTGLFSFRSFLFWRHNITLAYDKSKDDTAKATGVVEDDESADSPG